MSIIKLLIVLGISGFLAGCKLNVIATPGGDVESLSGARDCSAGNVCEFEITDTNFSESFTAIPKEGYVFSKWYKGGNFYCGDSVDTTGNI